jgi:signal transduction histidine kinase
MTITPSRPTSNSVHVADDAPGKILKRRIRRFGWMTILAGIVLLSSVAHHTAEPAMESAALQLMVLALVLLGGWATYRSISAYLSTVDRRAAELVDAARQDGVKLAANTLRHHIGNKLAVTVGYSEMLADDARLPPDAQEQANKVLTSAVAVVEVVRQLDEQLALIVVDSSLAGPALLDLNASTHR